MDMMNKRGLSDIVATVLIVLLALAAVAIVWGFLRPTFDNAASQTSLRNACFLVTVEPTQCSLSGATANVAYQLKTSVPTEVTLDSVAAVVEDDNGITYVSQGIAPTTALGSQATQVNDIGTASPFIARVAARVRDGSGNTETCPESVAVACN